MATGVCRLCETTAEIKISHIIPKFVYRWLKNTSATGYLRAGLVPDRRQQDGWKRPMLCGACEQLFSGWESRFRESVFMPLSQGNGFDVFKYESWFACFAVSLCWRVLLDMQSRGTLTTMSADLDAAVCRAESTWRSFLLGKQSSVVPHNVHLVPLGYIATFKNGNPPININRYYARVVAQDIVYSKDHNFVYCKLPFAVIVGNIHSRKPSNWINTRIHPGGGVYGIGKNITIPGELNNYMNDCAEYAGSLLDNLSPEQKEIVERSVREDLNRLARSKSFEAFESDYKLFGDGAYRLNNPPQKPEATE